MKGNKIPLFLCILVITIIVLSACSLSKAETGGNSDGEPIMTPEFPEDVESLVELAKFDLALEKDIDIDNMRTKSIEETLFDDSSLGVPQPGVEYEAVITPGYIILIEVGGDIYEYHASGEKVIAVPE